MQPSTMQEIVAAAAKKERERVATEIIEAQTKVVTASYNSAAAYTNLIMLGGYAGYFGLWQLTREHLSKAQTLWAALLILISLLTFIAFEVIKMILVQRAVQQKATILQSPEVLSNPEKILAALKALDTSLDLSMGPFMKVWVASVTVSAITALIGAGILSYAFICGLLR